MGRGDDANNVWGEHGEDLFAKDDDMKMKTPKDDVAGYDPVDEMLASDNEDGEKPDAEKDEVTVL